MANKKKLLIKLHFPAGHLGASPSDDALCLIIRALSLKHGKDDEWADKYGTDYEDDTICIHHDYQDYDCGCDYEPQEQLWLAANPHADDCFVVLAGSVVKAVEARHPLPEYEFFQHIDAAELVQFWQGGPGPTEEEKAGKKAKREKHESDRQAFAAASDIRRSATREAVGNLAKERGVTLKYDAEWSWQYHCTCGQSARHEQWGKSHEHVKPCPYWWGDQPNFLHKPTGIEVRWYKYIGRDMEVKPNPIPAAKWKSLCSLVTERELEAVWKKGQESAKAFAGIIAQANKRANELRKEAK